MNWIENAGKISKTKLNESENLKAEKSHGNVAWKNAMQNW